MDNVIVPSAHDELTAMLEGAGLLPSAPAPVMDEVLEDVVLTDEELAGIEAAPENVEITASAPSDEPAAETPETSEDLGEVLDQVAAEIAQEEIKAEAYAEQESEVGLVEAPVVAPKAPKAAKRAKREGAASPRTPRFTGDPADFVAAKLGSEHKEVVEKMAVKVKEKAVNLTEHLTAGKALSVYTKIAVDMLKLEGSINTTSLVNQLTVASKKNGGVGYSIGTARSQAGQQTALLQGFGIVMRDGGKLVPNEASPLWQKLVASAAPAAAAPEAA